MKLHPLFTLSLLLGLAFTSFSQSLIIPVNVNLPKDSVIKRQLIASLNSFITQIDKPNAQNTFILKDEFLAATMLLNEMKGIQKNLKQKDEHLYKPFLQNVVTLNDSSFFIQLNYIGIVDSVPILRAGFRLAARKRGDAFYFYSLLKQQTRYWKTKTTGNITFHFKDTLNIAGAKFYQKTVRFYDSKLKAPGMPVEDYYCDNFIEALQILGVDYKLEYNRIAWDNLSVHDDNTLLVINGWNSYQHRFDTHDLWHERLPLVVNHDLINRPVDEGCAYLYGGSWLIYGWQDIITGFKKYAAENPSADWLTLYIDDKNKNFSDGQNPLKIAYAVNALIVQKIEMEKGFTPVMELLACGKAEKGDENYFKALEKVSGITKANFNNEVWKLIRAQE